jgi:hypothetical protein
MSRRRFETGARARFGLAVLLVLFAPAAASASGLVVIDRPPPGWRPPPHVPHAFAPLELRRHHVTVSVAGQVATTRVEQTFFNPNDRPLEGTYLFPVPRGAKLDGFAMDIDGRLTEAELLDAAKARKIYEDIVRSLKDPALFEYAGQDLFKVRIFPLEPRKEKRVKLEYTQLLTADGGLIEYRLPLAPGKFSARPIESVSVTVRLLPADDAAREQAVAFVKGFKPIGGTAIADALDRGLKLAAAGSRSPGHLPSKTRAATSCPGSGRPAASASCSTRFGSTARARNSATRRPRSPAGTGS